MYKKITPRYSIAAIIILLLSLVLTRLYNINELFHFTYDESVFAYVGRRMFVLGHIPLIGGVTPFHVHLAPYFYWFSGIVLFINKFNPIIWGYSTALFSVFTGILIYLLVKWVYGNKTGLISLFLYTFSLYVIIFDKHYWGIFFNPFLGILTVLSLYKIIQKDYRFFILLFSALAFGFHTDPSTVVLLILSIISLIYFKIELKSNKYFYFAFIIFFISFIPLIIFDLRKEFVNIKGFGQYFGEVHETSSFNIKRLVNSVFIIPQFNSRIFYLKNDIDLAYEYSYCEPYASSKFSQQSLIFVILSALILIVFFKFLRPVSESQKQLKAILVIFIFSSVAGIIIYAGLLGRPFFDHYLTTLIPTLIIITSVVINRFLGRYTFFLFLILVLFLSLNLNSLKSLTHSYSYNSKNQAVLWVKDNIDGKFSLDSLGKCFKYNGYRYLFTLNQIEPAKSYVDQNFFWLFDNPPEVSHPDKVVVFVAADISQDSQLLKRYNDYKEREIISKKFNNLEVIIADNKDILYDF